MATDMHAPCCGVPYTEHLGLIGTCKQLASLRASRDEAVALMLRLVQPTVTTETMDLAVEWLTRQKDATPCTARREKEEEKR